VLQFNSLFNSSVLSPFLYFLSFSSFRNKALWTNLNSSFRCGVAPFDSAREILQKNDEDEDKKVKIEENEVKMEEIKVKKEENEVKMEENEVKKENIEVKMGKQYSNSDVLSVVKEVMKEVLEMGDGRNVSHKKKLE